MQLQNLFRLTESPRGTVFRPGIFLCLVAILLLSWIADSAEAASNVQTKTSVAFREDCESLIIENIEKAQKEIFVAIFTFTNRKIAGALVDASNRGVKVQVKMDRNQGEQEFSQTVVNLLRRHRISVSMIEMPPGYHMHHKFTVIDGGIVITGSYNYTFAATRENWENVVCIESDRVAAAFISEWRKLRSRSK